MPQFITALGLLLVSLICLPGSEFPQEAFQESSLNRFPTTPGERLHAAVRTGDLKELQRLLESGLDPNSPDALGNPALFYAAWMGNTEAVLLFLDHRANVNIRGKDTPGTALWYAVQADHARVVDLLVSQGARLDFRYGSGQTILHLACARGNPQIVTRLLAARADVSATDQSANTPLDEAVLNDRLEILRLLLAHGADPKAVHSLDGRGPMQEACIKGFAGLIPVLVQAGSDPLIRDRYGLSPLDLAVAYKNENVIRELLTLARSTPPLQAEADDAMESATLRGQTLIAKLLIDAGFDVNRPTLSGSTYLNDAALKGHEKLAQLLLDRGANLESRNLTGGTPLHDAALAGSAEVITLLLKWGAQIDALDGDAGATPLMLAASMDRVKAVEALLDNGADANVKDRIGRTALDRARETGDANTIKLLENAGNTSARPPRRAKNSGL
ncbi:MAG: ankyrin repeat domain-containing protein [Acidobacteriaceae bacterium]|nr:ankyrin repeat domain-containing protein [Acidobacteriaceae bacterium]MBV9499081.1 ankyrin repeat domain-containing protein [Acidobacteriaceae bacterium]